MDPGADGDNNGLTADPETDDLAATLPPRYRWLKRLAAGLGVFFALVVVLRIWWGYEAHRRLQAEIDRIQAAGEPIFPKDFDPTDVLPDSDNAAVALREAMDKLTTTAEFDGILKNDAALSELTPEQWQEIARFAQTNAEALASVNRARSMSGYDWGIRFRTPAIKVLQPHLAPLRKLAKTLRCTAAYYHRTGEDDRAIGVIRDALRLAETSVEPPTVISYLVGIYCYKKTASAIEFCAHDLAIGKRPGVERMGIEALVAELLDESEIQQGLLRAMYGERALELDCARLIVAGRVSPTAVFGGGNVWVIDVCLGTVCRPLLELDGTRMLEHMEDIILAISEPNWLAASRIVAPREIALERSKDALDMLKKPISWYFLTPLARSLALHYGTLAERRMAAIALAMRLYELDHGRRPGELAQLVPDYLSAVPLDPMAGDGRVISYLPDADPPILYSIGDDGVDDGGAVEFDAKGRIDTRKADLCFFLDGVRPQMDSP